jgi:hypothetical protein
VRKLKKFKRYAEGGALGAGGGDPFTYTDFKPGQGERNLEGIKDFFMGRRSKDEPSAPIEERQPPKVEKETKTEKAEPARAEPAKTSPVKTPSVAQQMKDREKGGPNERANYASSGKTSKPEYDSYSYGPDNLADGNEGVDSFTSTGNSKKAEEYRQSLMPGNKPKPKPPAPAAEKTPASAAEKTPAAPAKAPKAASPDEIPGTYVKTPYEGEKIDNRGLAGRQFAQSTLGATAAGRVVGPAVRGVAALGRMMSSPKAEGKGTGKFPESQTKEAPTYVDHRTAKPVRWRDEAAEESVAKYRAEKEQAKSGSKEAPKEASKAKPAADDEVAQEAAKRAAASRPRVTPKRQEDSAKFGGGKGTPNKVKARAEVKPTAKKFDKPVGEKEGPTVDKVLEREGLSAKKGGKIPAFKKGGMVGSASRRADGCATKGKTRGRMM